MDGTAIVGVVGILTSGIFGPMLTHRIQARREKAQDERETLDAATEPLAAATAQVQALRPRALKPKDPEWDEDITQLLTQIYLVESHQMKLHMRFGNSALTNGYGAAGGALADQAGAMWDNAHGKYKKADDFNARMAKADRIYNRSYFAFVDAARGVHRSSTWRVPGRLALGRGTGDREEPLQKRREDSEKLLQERHDDNEKLPRNKHERTKPPQKKE
jgi:hypothetical protein